MHSFPILEVLILALAISIDALVASFAYGSQKMKISIGATLIIGLISGGLLGITLFLGERMGGLMPDWLAGLISFSILFGLGTLRIFDSWLKNYIRRRGSGGEIKFSAFRLTFILQIYADPETADTDGSRTLSPGEALSLGIALSLDGIAAGLGAGLLGAPPLLSAGFAALLTILAIVCGGKLGGKLARVLTRDISWISGGLLILLAVLQI